MKFELSEEQIKKYEEWRKKNPSDYVGALGGATTFQFQRFGIGIGVTVKTLSNGKEIELDLTEYDKW